MTNPDPFIDTKLKKLSFGTRNLSLAFSLPQSHSYCAHSGQTRLHPPCVHTDDLIIIKIHLQKYMEVMKNAYPLPVSMSQYLCLSFSLPRVPF